MQRCALRRVDFRLHSTGKNITVVKSFEMLATFFFEMCARSTVTMNIGYQSCVCVRACVCAIHSKLELGHPMSVELHW